MTLPIWLTNDPAVAKRLKAIDKSHAAERAKTVNWSLAEKVSGYAKCDADKKVAYERVIVGDK